MYPRSSRRRLAALGLIALSLAATLATAGCAASDSADKASSAGAPQAEGAAAPADGNAEKDMSAGGAAADDKAGGTGTDAKPGAPDTPVANSNRSIIYTGSITLEVTDVAGIADQAGALALGVHGYIGSDKRTLDAYPNAHASLVLQVPSASFAQALESIGKLGKELNRATQTADVTEAVIDLDARIASQQASVTRTRALLARANSISEIVSVESELTKRESELASLQARKRELSGQVAYSTITVLLQSPPPPTTEPTREHKDNGFVAGLKSGWHAFLVAVQVVLTIIGALLPFAIVIGVPLMIFVWLRRRRAAGRAAAATGPGAQPVGALPPPPVSVPPVSAPPAPARPSAPQAPARPSAPQAGEEGGHAGGEAG